MMALFDLKVVRGWQPAIWQQGKNHESAQALRALVEPLGRCCHVKLGR